MSRQITAAAAVALLALLACERLKPAAELYAAAAAYHARADERAAIIELKNLLRQEPSYGAARLLLGQVYLEQGDGVLAEKELRRALDLGQPRPKVLPPLLQALALQGSYQAMLDATHDEGRTPAILAVQAQALFGLGKSEQAAALYEAALEKEATLVAAHLGLARIAVQAGDLERARQAVASALAADGRNIDALRFQADMLRAQGDYSGALAAYRTILALRPADMRAHADIAALYLQAGKPDQARAQLAQARALQPNSVHVHYTEGLLAYAGGNAKGALEQAQLVLRAAPEHAPSLLLAATAQMALNSPAQARVHLLNYRRLRPQEPYGVRLLALCAMREGRPAESLALLEPLLAAAPDDTDLLALAGEAALRDGKQAQSAAYFARASALAPDSAALQAANGLSLLRDGHEARAIAALERASELAGPASRSAALLVVARLRARQFPQALQQVEAMEREADGPAVQNLKGGVLLASGNLAGARQAFARALALDPRHLPALDNLAQLDLMQGKPDKARRHYLDALARQPDDAALLVALGKLELRGGALPPAIAWYEKAGAAAPDNTAIAQALAGLYLRGGHPDKALALARRLHASAPTERANLDLLAQAQAAAGDRVAALGSLERLASLMPGNGDVQLRIAHAQLALGRTAAALQTVRRALAADPDRDAALALASALLIDSGAAAEALKQAQAAQARRPHNPLGYKLAGDALMAQDKAAEAVTQYERGFGEAQNGPLLIALHRALLAAGRAPLAAQRMDGWLAAHADDLPTRLYYASHLLQQNALPAAQRQYQLLLERAPDHVLALNDLAWIKLQLKDGGAQRLAERAYRLAPANAAVADTLAWIYAETGMPARALPLFRKALAQSPAAGDIRLRYAYALQRSGDRSAARAQCQQLLGQQDFARKDEVRALLARL